MKQNSCKCRRVRYSPGDGFKIHCNARGLVATTVCCDYCIV